MPRSNSRYGTFEGSTESSRTELFAIDGRSYERETVSEVNLSASYIQSEDPIVKKQDWLIRNRLPILYRTVLHWLSDKGNLGVLITLHIAMIGIFMLTVTDKKSAWRVVARYMVSCGVLGVAGGITNWLALKILFTKIPGLYGSGVFASCYQEIIKTFRTIVTSVFLDQSFLEQYVEQKLTQHIVTFNMEGRLRQILESETIEQIINKELHALSQSSEGQLLLIAGIRTSTLKPLIRPLIMEIIAEVIPGQIDNLYIGGKSCTASRIKQEITKYMANRGGDVGTEQVTQFVKVVMYKHLSWLVILGCVIGFLMGIVSQVTEVGKLI